MSGFSPEISESAHFLAIFPHFPNVAKIKALTVTPTENKALTYNICIRK